MEARGNLLARIKIEPPVCAPARRNPQCRWLTLKVRVTAEKKLRDTYRPALASDRRLLDTDVTIFKV